MLRAVVDVSNEFPATVATAYLRFFFSIFLEKLFDLIWIYFSLFLLLIFVFACSLLVLVAWYVAWVAAVIFVQRFSSTVAYVLSVYLIFSFYWTCQGNERRR